MRENQRMLVVDDEASIRRNLAVGMAQRGYEVDSCEMGLSALEKIEAARRSGLPHNFVAGRVAAAPLRQRGAPGSHRQLLAPGRRIPAAPVRAGTRGPVPCGWAGQPGAPDRHPRPGRARRPEVPGLRARRAHRAAKEGRGHVQGHPQGRRAAAPPVPVVQADHRPHPAGGHRPRRGRHQADGVPHRRRFRADGGADRGHTARQGSDRGGGALGALRRGGQHQLGQPPGGSRRACRLWRGRPQDPRQDADGGAPRNRQAAPLRAPGHRQLPPAHRAHLHRFRPVHRQRRSVRGRERGVRPAHQPGQGRQAAPPVAVAVLPAQPGAGRHPQRDAQCPARASRRASSPR